MSQVIRLLMVEDWDDSYVVKALFEVSNVGASIIKDERLRRLPQSIKEDHERKITWLELQGGITLGVYVAGVPELLLGIPRACRLMSNLDALALVTDANHDFTLRWKEVRNQFDQAGYPLPELTSDGLSVDLPGGPRIGVWVMPNNADTGMLEDWLISLIPDNDKILPLVRQFVTGMDESIRPFKNVTKAILRTWMALQFRPERTISQTIAGDDALFDRTKANCPQYLAWLRRVLVDNRPELPAS